MMLMSDGPLKCQYSNSDNNPLKFIHVLIIYSWLLFECIERPYLYGLQYKDVAVLWWPLVSLFLFS